MQRLFWILIAPLFLASTSVAQTSNTKSDDVNAIRKVADLYISAQPANLQEAFYPTANLYTTDEKGSLRVISFNEYLDRVKKNSGSREDRKSTIQSIQHTGNAAIVQVAINAPDVNITDYLSLVRIEGHWKVVSKTFFVERHSGTVVTPQSQNPAVDDSACAQPEHHIFDFLVGSWTTSDSTMPNVAPAEGESKVEAMLGGCIVHEHRHITRQGKKLFDGDAYWGYDVTTKHWLLFYCDDASHAQLYEGRSDAGHLAFYRERPDTDGKTLLIRITYAPAANGYTQTVERSADHGATWQSGGITIYQPKH